MLKFLFVFEYYFKISWILNLDLLLSLFSFYGFGAWFTNNDLHAASFFKMGAM